MKSRDLVLYGALGTLALLLLPNMGKKPARGPSPTYDKDVLGGDVVDWYQSQEDGKVRTRTDAAVEWTVPMLSEKAAASFRAMCSRWLPQLETLIHDSTVDPALAMAIIYSEGATGNPSAVSSAGAVGLFQIMPFNWGGRTQAQMSDPMISAQVGLAMLKNIRDSRGKLTPGTAWEVPVIASRYNAGSPDGVHPWDNAAWLAKGRTRSQTSRWGVAAQPGYIDRVVAAYNTFLSQVPSA